MKVTFLTPPSLDKHKPAERTAGCTRVVYDMVNIYELTVAALLERDGFDVRYKNFVLDKASPADCFAFLEGNDSDVYFLWTVNLSIPTDRQVEAFIHSRRADAWCIFLGPGGTYFTSSLLREYEDSRLSSSEGERIRLISRNAESERRRKPKLSSPVHMLLRITGRKSVLSKLSFRLFFLNISSFLSFPPCAPSCASLLYWPLSDSCCDGQR